MEVEEQRLPGQLRITFHRTRHKSGRQRIQIVEKIRSSTKWEAIWKHPHIASHDSINLPLVFEIVSNSYEDAKGKLPEHGGHAEFILDTR